MRSLLQPLFQISFSVFISAAVWVATSMTLLSLPSKLTGGGFMIPNADFTESARWGLIVGLIHGILAGIWIWWRKADSAIGTTLTSIAVTEVMIVGGLLIGFFVDYFSRPAQTGKPRISPTFENIYAYIVTVIFWFMILSILFLVPSILIGITNRVSSVSPERLS